jgi:dihydrofolate reductase
MTVSVFVGVSVDGFMARSDGAFDFLDAGGGEPHGYEEFFATIDVLVIGRKTYELVMTFPEWPYGDKRVVVLSSNPIKGRGEWMKGEPGEIVGRLAGNNVYVDGGETIQRFLRAGVIDRLIVTRVPILIGQGIALFGALPGDVRLRHVGTQSYAGGMVKSEYNIER